VDSDSWESESESTEMSSDVSYDVLMVDLVVGLESAGGVGCVAELTAKNVRQVG
jgi:hypothetical protein